MGRRTANAKNFIISCRVSNEEMNQLQSIAKESESSISELLRKCLLSLQDDNNQAQMSA